MNQYLINIDSVSSPNFNDIYMGKARFFVTTTSLKSVDFVIVFVNNSNFLQLDLKELYFTFKKSSVLLFNIFCYCLTFYSITFRLNPDVTCGKPLHIESATNCLLTSIELLRRY